MSVRPPLGKAYPLGTVAFEPVYEQFQPRAVVKVNGQVFTLESYRLTLNAHGDADTAEITLPIATYPDWSQLFNAAALGPDAPIYIEIWAGFPQAGWPGNTTAQLVRRFYGILDTGAFRHEDDLTTLTCRSLAAPLLTTKITTPFAGQAATTTVAFLQQQAARFGLTTKVVLGPGEQPATMQQVLGAEFVTGVRNWTIWSLMLQCAQMDDVDLWVDSQGVLNYQTPSQVQRTTLKYVWGSNIKKLNATHASQFSKNIRVEVRSWRKRTRVGNTTTVTTGTQGGGITTERYTRTVTSSPIFGTTASVTTSISSTGTSTTTVGTTSGGPASSGFTTPGIDSGIERYTYYVQNKTPQVCDDIAEKIWRQISQHEWMIELVAPVTPTTLSADITALLAVSGSPFSLVNQKYWPREIEESLSTGEGFYRTYTAVNHENPLGQESV